MGTERDGKLGQVWGIWSHIGISVWVVMVTLVLHCPMQ